LDDFEHQNMVFNGFFWRFWAATHISRAAASTRDGGALMSVAGIDELKFVCSGPSNMHRCHAFLFALAGLFLSLFSYFYLSHFPVSFVGPFPINLDGVFGLL